MKYAIPMVSGSWTTITKAISSACVVPLFGTALMLLAGCGGSSDGQWSGRIEVASGVQRITSDAPIRHDAESTLDVSLTPDLTIAGAGSTPERSFTSIYGITTDRDGNIFIADTDNARILKFDPNGVFVRSIGSPGVGPMNFQVPVDMAVDAQNRLYVLDNQLNRVTVFNPDLQTIADIWDTPVIRPRRIRIDDEGNVLVFAITQHNLIYKFKPNGQVLDEFYDPKESIRIIGNIDQLIAYSDAMMEVTDDRHLFVSARHPYWIRKFDRVGGLALEFTRVTPFEMKPLETWKRNEQPPPVGISGAMAVFPNGRILNIIQYQEFERVSETSGGIPKLKLTKAERWFDFFRPDGKWEMTSRIKVAGFPMHVDRQGRIYFYEGEPARMIRYTVKFPEGVD
ncbi:MAG: NHL repeat-containing protein [candidate division Zixibacteria bacterium]|nr:NHL repeat-containing protein [candidate division Zixibacteria bacterium]